MQFVPYLVELWLPYHMSENGKLMLIVFSFFSVRNTKLTQLFKLLT